KRNTSLYTKDVLSSRFVSLSSFQGTRFRRFGGKSYLTTSAPFFSSLYLLERLALLKRFWWSQAGSNR
ncbi:hypothetical protein, partial [Paenibacillus larvae]|uniref:hypothetical protein n=2 Tax=Paenibacillus larvae TaxID=1464 RepID=UPI001A7E35F9